MIPVYKPYLPPGSLAMAHDALDSTWLSSSGKYIQMVTDKLQELLQVPYVIPLNNGTSACHLVAKSLLRSCPALGQCNKRVIVPNNVYVAAWNAFLFDDAYELISVDANLETWNVDIEKLCQTIEQYPDADVLIVHNVGNVIDVPYLQEKYPNTHFVEDNCEGFMGTYHGRMTGTDSLASAVSFFGNKNITCGEGGAFVTNFEEVYRFAKCVQGQGQSSKRFIHDELGYNYRMTNIQAAILCGQLDLLPTIKQMKQSVFTIYRRAFSDRDDVKVQRIEANTEHSNWMFGIRIPGSPGYDVAEAFFKTRNVEIRPMFYSINAHKHLQKFPYITGRQDDTNAVMLNKECLILPSFPELSLAEQYYIINATNEYIKELQ